MHFRISNKFRKGTSGGRRRERVHFIGRLQRGPHLRVVVVARNVFSYQTCKWNVELARNKTDAQSKRYQCIASSWIYPGGYADTRRFGSIFAHLIDGAARSFLLGPLGTPERSKLNIEITNCCAPTNQVLTHGEFRMLID